MKNLIKGNSKLTLVLLSVIVGAMTSSQSYAADVVVQSTFPRIDFVDDDQANTDAFFSWTLAGLEDGNVGAFTLHDFLGLNNHNVLSIAGNAGSTNNQSSLVVDASGDINLADGSVFIDKSANFMGIGTTTPGAGFNLDDPKLHLKSTTGFSGLIQENNGSAWLRDNGSSGAFISRLEPTQQLGIVKLFNTAPANSITATDVGVGIGTSTPAAKLDVHGKIVSSFSGENPTGLVELMTLKATNTTSGQFSDAGIVLENAGTSGFKWSFRTLENTGGFAASKQGTGGKEFEIRNPGGAGSAGSVELHLSNGASNVGGAWLDASSRSLKKNIHDLSASDAMQTLRELKTVKYQYKSDLNNTQMVGFIAEDVPELLATHSRKSLSSMKIVAVLAKALQVQDKSLQETQAQMKAKDAKIAEMEARLSSFDLLTQRLDKIEANLKLQ